ncbi:c-type cytochrome [Synechococcus elongatus]|uniref:CytM n=1 Tax=Synechococcus elongatus (strain ATCC 33912 / PCC 7942 / FACHB-805) TaxID=1140 RepID=Q9Z3G2_SYNE7|nr:cytochrome c [Synechococcus elongatus]AAD00004.1 CytM [Synechococcus elongatus PCC 7942 = FACHB-805]ABB57508.1 cytochrome CytM [Synechococcus elongatus PCC 7942 = FACHB-805]AJD57856.1 cytochrome [Synechococcus elongatus UTEX 2973]MBD2588311.1 c-type cytochrome [Synechococcus elongatus FACHB-242]MBD2689526.1 c-type cytochrome [Synechococcus elongatus FACHB-1061]
MIILRHVLQTTDSLSPAIASAVEQSLSKSIESRAAQTLGWLLATAVMVAIGLVVTLIRPADPYVSTVLNLPGNAERGQAIFQINCAGCHGPEGRGLVGPDLANVSNRKSRKDLIRQVTTGETPPMPKFQPSPETMADLLRYLETL